MTTDYTPARPDDAAVARHGEPDNDELEVRRQQVQEMRESIVALIDCISNPGRTGLYQRHCIERAQQLMEGINIAEERAGDEH